MDTATFLLKRDALEERLDQERFALEGAAAAIGASPLYRLGKRGLGLALPAGRKKARVGSFLWSTLAWDTAAWAVKKSAKGLIRKFF